MAAGKTSVGQRLAEQLGWEFVDLDTVIEQIERQSIAQIFSRSGQAVFRKVETAALEKTLEERQVPLVLALGGGAFSLRENRQLLEEADALTVYLSAPTEELWRRAVSEGAGTRPLLRDRHAFSTLFETRRADFESAALEVSTSGKDPQAAAGELAEIVKTKGMQ